MFLFKVTHSMKLREAMLQPWMIVNKSGDVLAAHCDCVAGCSETCSHVSAVLYFLANLHAQSVDRRVSKLLLQLHSLFDSQFHGEI